MNHYPDRLKPGRYLCGAKIEGETCPRCAAARKRRNYGGARRIEPGHGRGPGRGTVRCPCGGNTLNRAARRAWACCKAAGTPPAEIAAAQARYKPRRPRRPQAA